MKVLALVGPTAVGKTDVSLEVAERFGAEVVSVDSMQIYRGMDIGTAKPSTADRRRVRHHLLDLRDPADDVTVAEYQLLGREAIEDITARGRLPMLVGGSGLYFRAIVDELRFPPRHDVVRARLEAEARQAGPEPLYQRLRDLDPDAAARVDARNTRRIVRALEVIELTEEPFSGNVTWDDYDSRYDLVVAGLTRPRRDLDDRIARRVDAMLAAGLIDEVERLRRAGLGRTAAQAIGYRQVLDVLDEPFAPASVRDAIVKATRRFARRQQSWFRNDPRVTWFDATAPDVAGAVVGFFERSVAIR